MNTAILVAAVMFIAATSAAPLSMRCMELLNSIGPYDYCNKTLNISQRGNSVTYLVSSANNVTRIFQQICANNKMVCKYS